MSGIKAKRPMYARKPKVRVTQSLLSSWQGVFKYESGWKDFLTTLNREKKQPTQAMLDGIRYENCLNSVLNGERIDTDHEWYVPITLMAEELDGAVQQVTLFKEITVAEDQPVLLHGVLDYLREGHIWDSKFSKRYALNKYLNSPQTAMYLELVPEAFDFTYIITDGKYVYRERYPRDIVPKIHITINQFYDYLKQHGLWNTYVENWSVRN